MSDKEEDLDALRHNIQSKGKYSYYYGHADQDRIMQESGAAIKVAGGTPKLLKRTETPSSSSNSLKRKPITAYSWADSKKSVKIYIDLPGLDEIEEKFISHTNEEQSYRLEIRDKTVLYVLDIPNLSQKIVGAKFVKKGADRMTVTLKKKGHFTWYDLKKV